MVSHTDDNVITSVTVHPDSLSDHHRIELTISALKPAVKTVMIAKRNFRNIETDALRNDNKSMCADMTLCAGANARQAEQLVAMYNTYLTDCLDKHAPWHYVRVRDNPPHPWYDADIDEAREKKRKLENVWRRIKLEIHRQLYVTARDECAALISVRKADYYKNQNKGKQQNHVSTIETLDGQHIQQHPEFHSTA